MKKVYVVSKTHLDLGFTDYAENIHRKYIDEYNIHTVPTFIHENEAYAGTQKEKIKEILK